MEDNSYQELQKQIEIQKQFQNLENTVKQYLTKEAIARYGNIKSAHPEKAIQTVAIMAQLIQSGQITEKITDIMFKDILLKLEKPKKEFKITKK